MRKDPFAEPLYQSACSLTGAFAETAGAYSVSSFNSRASGHASSRGCHHQQCSYTCHLDISFKPKRQRHRVFRLCK